MQYRKHKNGHRIGLVFDLQRNKSIDVIGLLKFPITFSTLFPYKKVGGSLMTSVKGKSPSGWQVLRPIRSGRLRVGNGGPHPGSLTQAPGTGGGNPAARGSPLSGNPSGP